MRPLGPIDIQRSHMIAADEQAVVLAATAGIADLPRQ